MSNELNNFWNFSFGRIDERRSIALILFELHSDTKMKLSSKLFSTIAIFFVGWLMGILFSYLKLTSFYYESNHDNLRHSSSSSQEEGADSTGKEVEADSIVLQPNIISRNDDTGDDLNVFLFWPYDNRLLSRANYESLETILESYPRALIRTLAFVNDGKMRAHFGFFPDQFSMYQKLGYDVSLGMDSSDAFASVGIRLAHDYFIKWTERCCLHCYAPCHKLGQPLPYHLQLFPGLTKLYKKGGVLTDLSYRFQTRFNDPYLGPGFHIHSYCTERSHVWLWEQQSQYVPNEPQAHRTCYTSTLLIFNSPRHPVITCALARYGSDTLFAQCIENDLELGGVQCVADILKQCFSQHRVTNSLSQSIVSTVSTGKMKLFDATHQGAKIATPNILETFHYNYSLAADRLERQWTPTAVSSSDSQRSGKLIYWMGSLATSGNWRHSLRTKRSNSSSISRSSSSSTEEAKVLTVTSALYLIDGIENQLKADSNSTSTDLNATNSSILTVDSERDISCMQNRCRPFSTALEYLKRLGASTSYGTDIESNSCTPVAVVMGFSQSGVDEIARVLSNHPQMVSPAYSYEANSVPTLNAPYRSKPPRALLHRMWAFPVLGSVDNQWSANVPVEERAPFMTFDASGTYALDFSTPYILRQDNPNARALFVVSHPVHRMYREYISIYKRVHGDLERLTTVSNSSSSSPAVTSSSNTNSGIKVVEEQQNLQNMLRLLSTGFDSLAEYGMSFPTKYSVLRRLLTNATHSQSQSQSHSQSHTENTGGVGSSSSSSSSNSASNDLERQMVALYYKDVFINGVITPLFAHSIAFPAIAHFQQVLGHENVRVYVSEDRHAYSDLTPIQGANKTLLVGHKAMISNLENFLGLCPHQHFKTLRRRVKLSVIDDDDYESEKDDTVRMDRLGRRRAKHADSFDDSALPPELRMSRPMYLRLVKYFSPFVSKLGVHLGLDLAHWTTSSPVVLQQLTESVNNFVNASATDGQDASWFELGDSTGLVGKTARVEKTASLIAKLLPHNDPRYDTIYNIFI